MFSNVYITFCSRPRGWCVPDENSMQMFLPLAVYSLATPDHCLRQQAWHLCKARSTWHPFSLWPTARRCNKSVPAGTRVSTRHEKHGVVFNVFAGLHVGRCHARNRCAGLRTTQGSTEQNSTHRTRQVVQLVRVLDRA